MRLILAAALAASSAHAAPRKAAVDAAFELQPPSGWKIERAKDGAAVLTGPAAQGIAARVVARWVKADHPLYGTPEAYMARLNRPSSVPMKGWKNGPVESAGVAGRKALRMVREATEFADPDTIAPKEVSTREEHVAVPGAGGFHLLVYSAAASADKARRAEFRRMLEKGFKPKL